MRSSPKSKKQMRHLTPTWHHWEDSILLWIRSIKRRADQRQNCIGYKRWCCTSMHVKKTSTDTISSSNDLSEQWNNTATPATVPEATQWGGRSELHYRTLTKWIPATKRSDRWLRQEKRQSRKTRFQKRWRQESILLILWEKEET